MPYKSKPTVNDAWPLKRRKVRDAEKAALKELESYVKAWRRAMAGVGGPRPGKREMALIAKYEELERARSMPATKRP